MNSRWPEIGELSLDHLELVSLAVAIATAIALPTAVLLSRRASLRRWVVGFPPTWRRPSPAWRSSDFCCPFP